MVRPDEFLLSFTWLLPNVLFIDERVFLGAARTCVGPALEGRLSSSSVKVRPERTAALAVHLPTRCRAVTSGSTPLREPFRIA